MRTAKVSTNAFSQLLSREQTIRFHNSLLGMHPLRLDGVEPGMSAGSRVYFSTKSAEHQVDELVAMAGVEPTRTWEKGKHIRHHGFEVRPSFKETGDVEDKLRTIISLLLPYTANVHALSAIADVGINIAYWGYKEQMWGIHFGTDIIQGLAVLHLSVDVDLYASGPDLGTC